MSLRLAARAAAEPQEDGQWGPSSWATCPSPRAEPRCVGPPRRPGCATSGWSSSTPTAAAASSTASDAHRVRGAARGGPRELREAGVEHEVRQLVRGMDPADDLVNVADRGLRRVHRDRAAPPLAGRQADPRQQRPAGAPRRPCPVLAVKADEELRRRMAMIQIAQDAARRPGADREPVRAADGDDARPAVPDGARVPRARPRCWTASARSTRRRSRPPTPRSSRRCARCRRPCTGSPGSMAARIQALAPSSSRSTTGTPTRLWQEADSGASCCAGCRRSRASASRRRRSSPRCWPSSSACADGLGGGRRRLRRAGLPPVGRRRRRPGLPGQGAGVQEGEEEGRRGLSRTDAHPTGSDLE